MPDYSKVELIFKDFKFDFRTDLKLDSNGYLDPIVYSCEINFGDSYLYHDNPVLAFIMHQFIYFGIVIVENSVYFVGEYIFSDMLGPVMDDLLHHYRYEFVFPSLVRGQNTYDVFEVDYRNTWSPQLYDGHIDFFMAGDLFYNGKGCQLTADFLSFDEGDVDSQIVVSESAATCWANQIAKSNIGHVTFDQDRINAFWGSDGSLGFNTTSEAVHFPILEEKLGPNMPLLVEMAPRLLEAPAAEATS